MTTPQTEAQPGTLAIDNARPYGEGEPTTLLIKDGVIAAVGSDAPAERRLDARGAVVVPGLVDLFAHLGEPGSERDETIATASAAAARGGYTALVAAPDTEPALDDPIVAEAVWRAGLEAGLVDVQPAGTITRGGAGETLTEMGLLARSKAAVRLFSDQPGSVADPVILRRALQYARGQGALIAERPVDARLAESACAHEGPRADRLGLRGQPRSAEEAVVARDALLARDAGAALHLFPITTAGSARIVELAKEAGVELTCSTTPHHLLLDDSVVDAASGEMRVEPPLREASDVEALREALLGGAIDCVASDHRPVAEEEKACELEHATPGFVGLETTLPALVETFIRPGLADWRWLAAVLSERPARIAGLSGHGRPVAPGEPANLAVIDPEAAVTVRPEEFASKSTNTPFSGREFHGRVEATVLRGRVTYQR